VRYDRRGERVKRDAARKARVPFVPTMKRSRPRVPTG
jgi:hypothetical protein